MKTILLSALATFAVLNSNGQVVLNEVYTDPSAGNSEFFELYNPAINENLDNYTLIAYFEEGSNTGFYVLDLPNQSIASNSFFIGAAASPFAVQGATGIAANFSWNNLPASASLTKWQKNGSGYAQVSVPANLNDLFVKRSGSGAAYNIFLFKNGALINGLIGATSTTTIPSFIKSMPSLFVDMTGSSPDFTVSFTAIADNQVEYITPTPGSDNGYVRKQDGKCGQWDKSSSQATHTPGTTNGAATGGGSLTIASYIVTGSGAAPSYLYYNITAGTADAFPATMQSYRDLGVISQYDASDLLFDTRTIANTNAGLQQVALPNQNDKVILIAKAPAGCLNAVVAVSNNIILPVRLTSFQGNLNNKKVVLNWSVASNETTDKFEVERSFDGVNFSTIAVVFASQKAGAESYTYFETVTSASKIYYRLKMYDNAQVVNYSKTLVFQTKTSSNNEIKVLANPVSDKLTFSFQSETAQQMQMTVFDIAGRVQIKQSINFYQGSNLISLPLNSTFATGMYVVDLSSGTDHFTAKFIKQ